MNNSEIVAIETGSNNRRVIAKLPLAALLVALVGVADSVYLTVHHYTAEPVPCSVITGCEQVLTSSYAAIGGVPLAAFGVAAYLAACALALAAAFGKRFAWVLFGVHVFLMFAFTVWLLYLQAFVIEAFCQFCLLSAATTTVLLLIYVASLWRRGNTRALG